MWSYEEHRPTITQIHASSPQHALDKAAGLSAMMNASADAVLGLDGVLLLQVIYRRLYHAPAPYTGAPICGAPACLGLNVTREPGKVNCEACRKLKMK